MGIRFGANLKTINALRVTAKTVTVPKPAVLSWTKTPGNIGSYPSGSEFAYWLGAVDPADAIDVYELIGGALPAGITLNPFSGDLEGTLPDVAESQTYNFTIRVKTSDNRHLYGDFSMTVEFTELFVQWVTPQGSLGEYDIGAPVTKTLEAKANK